MPLSRRLTVALAALVAAGCGGSGTPTAGSSSNVASPLSQRSIDVSQPRPTSTTPSGTRPTVSPPSGARVLAGPIFGDGPGLVATVHVPRRFAIIVACAGTGRFVIVVEGRRPLRTRCGQHSTHFVYEPLGKPEQVTVRIETLTSVRWAVLLTTGTR